MSAESNIVLITNDDKVENILKPKLILLREIDNILTASYTEAVKNVKEILPEIVLLHCKSEASEKDACLKLIKTIKTDADLKNISILLIIEAYDQDFILNAYDENVTDYLALNADDAEVLIRTIWSFKKNSLETTIAKQHSLLEQLNIIDKKTGFYSSEYCEKIFENEFKTLRKSKDDGILMLVSASEESKTKLSPIIFANAIKNSTRNSDVIVHAPSNRFYILLAETNLKGAYCVWDKIKAAVGEGFTINASVSLVGDKSFDAIKNDLLNALIEANSTNQDLVVANEEEKPSSDDWLGKIGSTQKNFKLFKQAFNKKLDKVITPVFFQMQKLYEEKLFKSEIEQYSNSTLSAFILKNPNSVSELKITYPGFSKINIDIIHQGLDSPENKRISLDLTELDEEKLTKILEDFIQEFKTTIAL